MPHTSSSMVGDRLDIKEEDSLDSKFDSTPVDKISSWLEPRRNMT